MKSTKRLPSKGTPAIKALATSAVIALLFSQQQRKDLLVPNLTYLVFGLFLLAYGQYVLKWALVGSLHLPHRLFIRP